jgi:Fe2+ transport system protein FeoA
MCKVGSRVIVKDLFFEMDYLNRFYSLGIYPGADLEVMAASLLKCDHGHRKI